ncbi:MAG: dephospho-CoA kinase [Pleomorphochaeta sp.]
MRVIGLTGKACSGKNYVAQIFEDKGFNVIDVDKLGHKALIDKQDKIVKAFGEKILENNIINRKTLGNIVFSSPEKLKLLESIVHPYIKLLCIDLIKNSEKDIILNAAILQRGKLVELCDNVIFVKAPFFLRYKRSKTRDKRSFIWFLKRDLSQKDINIKELKKEIDVNILINKSSENEIYRQIVNICGIFNIEM